MIRSRQNLWRIVFLVALLVLMTTALATGQDGGLGVSIYLPVVSSGDDVIAQAPPADGMEEPELTVPPLPEQLEPVDAAARQQDGDADWAATGEVAPAAIQAYDVTNWSVQSRLGVGTDAPAYKIDVRNYANDTARIQAVNSYVGAVARSELYLASGAYKGLLLQSFGSGYTGLWGSQPLATWTRIRSDSGSGGLILTTGGSRPLIFGTGDSERMRISPYGEIGIGATSPNTGYRITIDGAGTKGGIRIQRSLLEGIFVDHPQQDGIAVYEPGDDGLQLVRPADDGVFVNSPTGDGLQVDSAGGNGVNVSSSRGDGVLINRPVDDGLVVSLTGDDGIYVNSPAGDGLQVDSAGVNGLLINGSVLDGVQIHTAGGDGVYVGEAGTPRTNSPSGLHNGFEVAGAEGHGVFVGWADHDGVQVRSSQGDGISSWNSTSSGLRSTGAGADGILVETPGASGMQVISPTLDGMTIRSPKRDGIRIYDPAYHGVEVFNATKAAFYAVEPAEGLIIKHPLAADGSRDGVIVFNGNISIRGGGSFMVDYTTLNVPDYVFEPDYALLSLAELRAYVAKEKHLPNMPSADEVVAQGVDLGATSMLLLEKVEELTLYTLQQDEQITALQAQNEALEARLAALEKAIDAGK